LTLKWVSSMREIRPQAMVHPKQAALATRCVLPSASTFLPAVVAAMNAGKSLIPETSCVPRIAALQVLRTHHRANAGTARRPVQSAST
jgi:hypothetical protein